MTTLQKIDVLYKKIKDMEVHNYNCDVFNLERLYKEEEIQKLRNEYNQLKNGIRNQGSKWQSSSRH